MNEEQRFWDHLATQPGDFVTWAVYADWLNDQGRYAEEVLERERLKVAVAYSQFLSLGLKPFALFNPLRYGWVSDKEYLPSWASQPSYMLPHAIWRRLQVKGEGYHKFFSSKEEAIHAVFWAGRKAQYW